MATLKYSRQRESIKEFLMTRKDHPTADVLDLETEDLNEVAEKAVKNFSGKITECDIRFFGICPKCMNN